MNQTSLVGRPLAALTRVMMEYAEKRGVWSGPLTSSSPELARLWGAGSTTSTGVYVTEMTALTYSTVWACVNNISTDVASLPLILYKRTQGGGKERLTDHKLYRVLHDEPNPEMSSMTFRGVIQAHVLTWGNGYAEIIRDGAGRVIALWPITPDRVCVKRDRTGAIYYEVSRPEGGMDRLPASDMLHIQGLGYDGMMGYNLIAQAREAIALGLATERFGGSFFGNGATIGGVISIKDSLTEAAKKSFREQMAHQHQGVAKAHGFLLLGNEATYQKLGIDPDHAQFIETRGRQVEEICRFFRMPPHKVQHLERSTNNNIEHQGIEYYSDTLRPWCVRWEQEIKRKLIAPSERMIQFAEHKIEGVLRGDLKSRYDAYAVGRQWGWLSANRICELENMDPLPAGGDVFLVPMNMSPADRLNDIIDKQVAPDPAPAAPAPKADTDDGERMQQVVEQIRTEIGTIHTSLGDKLAELANVTATSARFDDFSDVFQARIEALSAEITEARQQERVLNALLIEATQRADRVEAEKDAVRLEAEHVAQELQRAVDAAHAEGEQAKTVAAEEAARLQSELEVTATARAEAERDVKQFEQQADAEEAERLHVTAQRDAAALEIERVQAELAAMTVRAAQVEADQRIMQQTAAAAALALTALQADLVTADALMAETSKNFLAERAAVEAARAQVAELEAAIATVRQDKSVTDAELVARMADAAASEAAAADAHRVATEATAKLQQATADADAARQRLEAETALVDAERAEKAALVVLMETQREAHAAREQAVLSARRDQVLDTLSRQVRVEADRARRNQGTPAKLKAWAEAFYLQREEQVLDALRPDMRAHLVFIGSTEDVDVYTRRLIAPQLLAAVTQIRTIAEGDSEDFSVSLERLLTKWEQERPVAIADRVFQEEMTYVRSL